MARCRCTEEKCSCRVVAGPGVAVVGEGSSTSPFIVSTVNNCIDCSTGANPGDVLTLYPDGYYRGATPTGGGGGTGGAAVVDHVSIKGYGSVVDPFRVCLVTYDDLAALAGNCAETVIPPPTIGAVEPNDVFVDATVTSGDASGAAQVVAAGYGPASTPAWTPGEFFTINTFRFYWAGSTWLPGSTPLKPGIFPGDYFPPDGAVTAEDATNAATLDDLGYLPFSTAVWATGLYFTLGTFHFSWDGTAWDAGAAP